MKHKVALLSIGAFLALVWAAVAPPANAPLAAASPPHKVFAPLVLRLPTPTPTPPPPLVVADFNACNNQNNLGGFMGAAYNAPDKLIERLSTPEPDRGCRAELRYTKIANWVAFWLKMMPAGAAQGADIRPYRSLSFDVRADPPFNADQGLKIEIKGPGPNGQTQAGIARVYGVSGAWQTREVALSSLQPVDWYLPLSSLHNITETVFVLDTSFQGQSGKLYLDNVVLR